MLWEPGSLLGREGVVESFSRLASFASLEDYPAISLFGQVASGARQRAVYRSNGASPPAMLCHGGRPNARCAFNLDWCEAAVIFAKQSLDRVESSSEDGEREANDVFRAVMTVPN